MKYIKELDPNPSATPLPESIPAFILANELPEGMATIFPDGITQEVAYQVLETALNGWADTNPDRLRLFVRENPPESAEEFILYAAAFSRAGLPFTITRRR